MAGAELARMAQIKRHLDAHLGEVIELVALAREHGMTERRLAQGFRRVYGKTVSEYLGDARMKRARLMLQLGRASVTEVAFHVGYGHVANFSTAFKRTFGVSPQAMRKDVLTDTPRRAASNRDT
jgi:AraC-like DNA-binding protein